MNKAIKRLEQKEWQDYLLPMGYTTCEFYDVEILREADTFYENFVKKTLKHVWKSGAIAWLLVNCGWMKN